MKRYPNGVIPYNKLIFPMQTAEGGSPCGLLSTAMSLSTEQMTGAEIAGFTELQVPVQWREPYAGTMLTAYFTATIDPRGIVDYVIDSVTGEIAGAS